MPLAGPYGLASVGHLSRADVGQVDEVGGLADHAAVDPPPPPLLEKHMSKSQSVASSIEHGRFCFPPFGKFSWGICSLNTRQKVFNPKNERLLSAPAKRLKGNSRSNFPEK